MGRIPKVRRPTRLTLPLTSMVASTLAVALVVACGAWAPAHAAELRVRVGSRGAHALGAQLQRLHEREAASAKVSELPAPRARVALPVLLGPGESLEAATARIPLEVLGTSYFHGYAVATVGMRASEAVTLDGDDVITLWTAPTRAHVARPQRVDVARDEAARATLAEIVLNPEALTAYAPAAPVGKGMQTTSFAPSVRPSLEGSPVKMLILTRDVLQSAFEDYADDRTRAGIPTVVRTIEWIEQNYPHGADLQETLRLFIRDAYALWGIDTLLLGGDTDVVPARYAYSSYTPNPEEVPTDLYYACLDGGWNDDGDAHWGEAFSDVSDPGDNADLYPELHVGRLPVHTAAEVATYRTKLDAYLHRDLDRIIGAIAARLHPERWDAQAKPVRKTEAAPPDENGPEPEAEPETDLEADLAERNG